MTARTVHVEHVMGTAVSFDVRGHRAPRPAIDRACAWLHEVDATYSTYRPDSLISRLDRGDLALADLPEQAQEVLEHCEWLERETAGAFDLHAHGRLDPSGYVKGWAIQRAADLLAHSGVRDFMVNGGGDIVVRGNASTAAGGWRIGVTNPHNRHELAAVAVLHDRAIATSSRSERGDHVPARQRDGVLDSATVVASDLAVADAWATAVLAGGTATLELAARRTGLDLLAVTGDRLDATRAFPFLPVAA